jgi:hypothetical protein
MAVVFYQGTTPIGMASAAQDSILWKNVPAGIYTLTARATDNYGVVTTSPAVTICVRPSIPAPSGLVSWWQAESNANDSVSGNNGTLQGGVSFASGEVGRAFVFNGSSATVSVPASPSLNVGTGSGFTLESWIAPTIATNQEPLMEWRGNGGSIHNGVHFWLSVPFAGVGGPGCVYANIVDTTGLNHIFASAPGIIRAGILQHVALTYDKASGLGKMYYNGALVASNNLGIFTPKTDTALLLGRRMDFGNLYYQGIMDETAIVNRALSQTEIQAIYSTGGAGMHLP